MPAFSPPPILFVRHGETDWNRDMRFQGQRDIPLNALGRRQAARNGRVIAPLIADGRWRWTVSPLGRTRQTCEIIRAGLGNDAVDVVIDERLKEISFGAWEGMTALEIEDTDPAGHEARNADKWRHCTPGGESYAQMAKRVGGWLGDLEQPTIAVSHGGVMRALMHLCTGMPTDVAPVQHTPQDRIVLFKHGTMTFI